MPPQTLAREMFKKKQKIKMIRKNDGTLIKRKYYVCKICLQPVTRMSEHIWYHNKPATPRHGCKLCKYKSHWIGNVVNHIKNKHSSYIYKKLSKKYKHKQ